MNSARLWVVALLMSGTAILLHVRGDVDKVPSSLPLTGLPSTIGPRSATDIALDTEVLDVLGKGFFLNRIYMPVNGSSAKISDRVPVGLFIGYFPTQRTGQSIHSPQNCLPGAGWSFQSSGVTDLTGPSGKRYSVGEYLISNGSSTQEVLYWYQMHGHSIASDYRAKVFTLIDSMRYGRTDAALVRIITTVVPGEDRVAAHDRAVEFAEQIIPLLPAYVPD